MTAEQFLKNKMDSLDLKDRLNTDDYYLVETLMKEFTEFHVEECKNKLWNKINPEIGVYLLVHKEELLNAYPLENIK